MNRLGPLWLCSAMVCGASPARASDTLMPRIIHEACTNFETGTPFVVLARFEDESQLFDPKVIYRTRSDSHWMHASFTKVPGTEDFRAVLKTRDLREPVEYFIEVFDEHGNGPARMGSPDAPIRVLPTRAASPCHQVPTTVAPVTVTEGSKRNTGIDGKGPPPPRKACDLEDRPLYCEAWLWATVSTVVAAGVATLVYFVGFAGNDDPTPVDSVTLTVTGPNPAQTP